MDRISEEDEDGTRTALQAGAGRGRSRSRVARRPDDNVTAAVPWNSGEFAASSGDQREPESSDEETTKAWQEEQVETCKITAEELITLKNMTFLGAGWHHKTQRTFVKWLQLFKYDYYDMPTNPKMRKEPNAASCPCQCSGRVSVTQVGIRGTHSTTES